MQKDVILTPEGLEKLKKEIEHLSDQQAAARSPQRIKEAREFGDISENSEYDDAKNEQAMLEARIAQLEDKLRSAQVINASELDSDVVRVGSLVSVKDEKGKRLQLHDRRLDGGRPGQRAAVQRVAGRQGARRPQEGRHREGAGCPRGERTLTITEIERRVGLMGEAPEAASELLATRRAQARRPARRGHRPVPARLPRRAADRGGEGAARRRSSPGEETDVRAPRSPGRLAARRGQGKAAFLDLVDRSGRMQLHARVDVLGEERDGAPARRSTSAT